jgi:heme-degrading monooxygenase HmoA
MPYARISLMKPNPGEEEEAERLNREIMQHSSEQSGYIAGYVLKAQDDTTEICRITLWESPGDSDRAANSTSIMSLRAQLHLKVQEGHADRSFSDL